MNLIEAYNTICAKWTKGTVFVDCQICRSNPFNPPKKYVEFSITLFGDGRDIMFQETSRGSLDVLVARAIDFIEPKSVDPSTVTIDELIGDLPPATADERTEIEAGEVEEVSR